MKYISPRQVKEQARLKKWIALVLGCLIALSIVFVGALAYAAYSNTRETRVPVKANPGLIGLNYQDVSFPSLDDRGLILRGWFLPSANIDRAIVIAPGSGSNRLALGLPTLNLASEFVAHGYSVLMFDLRGEGQSDGSMISGGYYERKDVEGAVAYVEGRGFSRIGVLGFSLGAASALMAAAEDPHIDAVVSDSSFANLLNDVVKPKYPQRARGVPRVFLYPLLLAVRVMYGVNLAAVNPVDYVARISPRPVFFIQGADDTGIGPGDALELFRAAHSPRDELWIVPGAGHTKAYLVDPQEYVTRVIAFFDAALK